MTGASRPRPVRVSARALRVAGLVFVVVAAGWPAAAQGLPPGFGRSAGCVDPGLYACWSDRSCITSHQTYLDAFSGAAAEGSECVTLWTYEAASRGSGVAAALLATMFAGPGSGIVGGDWAAAVAWARTALAPDRTWFSVLPGEEDGGDYYAMDTALSGLFLPTVALRPLSLYRAADVLAAAYERGFGGLEPDPALALEYYGFARTVVRVPINLGRFYPSLVSGLSPVLDDGFTRSLILLDHAVESLCWAYPRADPEACTPR